ncbi:hypothetical protein CL633_02425 [bacterium]|nr:hypothetical protein [bacterium]|tara:strand:- start:46 stop:1515 length:1470 start_codon:yes stop_codon:yes gene_type:complete
MTEQPLVSVVVTTFNRAKRLKNAIKSIQEQTFQNFEIIVVDDASTDDTEKVVKKLQQKDDHIKYIKRKENWGCHSRPKNDGILASNAKLVALLDDDNTYRKDHLQALLKAKEQNPDVQMVYGDRWQKIEDGSGQSGPAFSSEWHPMILQYKNYIDTSDILIEKQVLLDLGGFDESLKKFADWNLFVRFAKAGYRAKRVPLILTDYTFHAGMAQLKHKSLVGPDGQPLPTFQPHECKTYAKKSIIERKKFPKVAILTVMWHRLDYTKRTVESMKAKAGYDFDHVIAINEATKEESDWVSSQKGVGLFTEEENVGVPKMYNRFIDEFVKGKDYDIVVLTDNDCEFMSEDWLAKIVDLYERNKKFIVSPYVEGLRDNPGGSPRVGHQNLGIPQYAYVGKHFLGFPHHMGNICQAMPVGFWDNFRLDENTFKHGTQSFQISKAAMEHGFVLAYMEQVKVEHMDTTAGQKEKDPKAFDASQNAKTEKYESKHNI